MASSSSNVVQDATDALAGLHFNPDICLALPKTIGENYMNKRPISNSKHTFEKSKTGFLDLPAELRLRIYDHALIFRHNDQHDSFIYGNTQRHILLHLTKTLRLNLGVGLIRTCRQIYHEANPILYAQNSFSIREAEDLLDFIDRIGLGNTALITRIHIWVSYLSRLGPWLQLLRLLAASATGLRHLQLGWGALTSPIIHLPRGERKRGYGDNIEFVRALAEIRGLDELVIEGYYAKHWPEYLEKETGAQVRTKPGECHQKHDFCSDGMSARELELQEWYVTELKDLDDINFKDYQRGTEDLLP